MSLRLNLSLDILRRFFLTSGLIAIFLGMTGCGSPNAANIVLRKENQQLQTQISELSRQHDADRATILAQQQRATTVPVLPEDQLDQLFTVAGLQFGRLTGGFRPDPDQPPDTMLKVYVIPIDQAGDPIKSAGTFHIELFDLNLKSDNRLGQWDFDGPATKAHWFGQGLLYTYVLDCPWQTTPVHTNLLARVMFTDALTHRVFTVDREVTIQLSK